jgi:multidrug efflux system outer membrane protein
MMRKTLLATALSVALTGCAVGPTYQRPDVPVPAQWEVNLQQANDLANTTWWNQFRDPVLNDLIQIALQENKDVKIAAARVEEFMGRYGVTRSAQFPQVGANADAARTRNSENGGIALGANPSNAFEVNLGVFFELDLWGKLRSATEAARAQLLATEEAKRTVILSLVSQLANSYVQLLDYDKQLAVTRDTLGTRSESVRINGLRFKAGLISELDYQQPWRNTRTRRCRFPCWSGKSASSRTPSACCWGAIPGKISGASLWIKPSPAASPRRLAFRRIGAPSRHPPGGAAVDRGQCPNRGGQGGIFPQHLAHRAVRGRQHRSL